MKVLVINPGSTSTKVACFEDAKQLFSENLDLKGIDYTDEDGYRILEKLRERTEDVVKAHGIDLSDIDAFMGRGGKMAACAAGVYRINGKLLADSDIRCGRVHALRYSPHLADLLANRYGGKAFVMNTQSADELDMRARFTGFPEVWRKSGLHILNHKEMAARAAEKIGTRYEDAHLIVAHLGGGISVAAHKKGAIVDFSGGNGEGPMAPNRSGTIPAGEVITMAFSGKYTREELGDKTRMTGGMMAHLGTADARETERRIAAGDKYAECMYEAMIYQICKYIGAMAVSLEGCIDAIILTGGMANSRYLTDRIKEQTGWIADVLIMPGEVEMEGLAAGAVRVLNGTEEAKEYTGQPVFDEAQMIMLREKSLNKREN